MDDIIKLTKEALIDQRAKFGDCLYGGIGPDCSDAEAFRNASSIESLKEMISGCSKCGLSETRHKFVFGKGDAKSRVMVIGEAPGADEDRLGEPFVGRSGNLLTDILKAINFSREELFIANILKCRPPQNRTPNPEEVALCLPYLMKQIELIDPVIMLCVGLTAAQALLKKKDSMSDLRGKRFQFCGRTLMVTYHPAALLRNPNLKRNCWEDVQNFRRVYDSLMEERHG